MSAQSKIKWLDTYHLPFTWSHSRDQLFRLCRRQYYWRYYAPYGGNSPDEEGDRALYYLLGRLTSIPALIGSTIHNVARDALVAAREGRPWDAAVYTATADLLLRRSLSRSLKICEHPAAMVPRQTVILMEHYYHQPVDESQALTSVMNYTQALLDHPLFRHVLAQAQHLVLVDEVRRFNIEGVSVFAVPDVLFKSPDWIYWLIDWKTGSAVVENLAVARIQLAIYGLYLNLVEGIQSDAILCKVVDLRKGGVYEWYLSAEQRERSREHVKLSVAEMQRCLRDVTKNEAKQDDYSQVSLSITGDVPCVRCAFRQVCFGSTV